MKPSKGIIKEHDLVIYPLRFTIAIGDVEKEVNAKYEPYDGIHNYVGAPKPPAIATTYNVRNRETKDACLMIWVPSIEDCTSEITTHECNHAALEIFKRTGAKVDVDNQEPFCYLSGALSRLFSNTAQEVLKPKSPTKPIKPKKK